MPKERKKLTVGLEIKSITEDGQFDGLAAVYGNVDLGDDVIESGAFSKTIKENGAKVPLLWEHKTPIGIAYLEDSTEGLKCHGILNLEKSFARDCYSDLKFFQAHQKPMGMSIGYTSIPDKTMVKDGIRHLRELKLWENTVTIMPMNQKARVAAVKSAVMEIKDFAEELQEMQAMSAPSMMMDALSCSLMDLMWDGTMGSDEKITAASESIDQFGLAFPEALQAYLAMRDEMMKTVGSVEVKAGRKLSADTRRQLTAIMDDHQSAMDSHRTAMDKLKALLDAEDENASATEAAKSVEAEPGKPTPAEAKSAEPVDHSKLISTIDELKGVFKWKTSK